MPANLDQARSFLEDRFACPVTDVGHLGAGAWSQAFAFRRADHDYVIRFGAHGEDFAKDRLAATHAGPALPIPRILELGQALGGYYAISERVFGGYIDDLDEAQMRALLPALFAALDAMRLADVTGTTGCGMWNADGAAPHPTWREALLDVANDRPTDRIHGWRERLRQSPIGVGPFDQAYACLAALAACLPEERHLIHSDLLHWNVLVDGDGIAGVLDWGCAKYGDFLYDLAWICFCRHWYPAWQSIDFRAEALRHYASIGLDVPHFDERLRCCQIHIGLDSLAYLAHTGDWAALAETARITLELAR